MATVLGIIIAFLLMGYIGGKIARRPGRPFSHGFWLCGFLSLIGLLVLLSLGRLDAEEYRGGGAARKGRGRARNVMNGSIPTWRLARIARRICSS